MKSATRRRSEADKVSLFAACSAAFVVLLVALLFASSPVAGAQELPANPTLDLVVEPTTGLIDGQMVSVSSSNLEPNANIVIVQCAADSTSAERCDLSRLSFINANRNGEIAIEFRVSRQIRIDEGLLDCAPDNCVLGIGSLDEDLLTPLATGGVPLNFDASVPLPPPPTLDVSKKRNLTDGQKVRLTGSGWATNSEVGIEQCVASNRAAEPDREEAVEIEPAPIRNPGACRWVGQTYVDGDGEFSTTVVVRRAMYAGEDRIDCAQEQADCRLVVTNWHEYYEQVKIGLRFNDDEPLPAKPKLRISPRRDLVNAQEVTVSVVDKGEVASDWQVMQCPAESGVWGDGCRSLGRLAAGADITPTVARSLLSGRDVIDCASASNACAILAVDYQSGAIIRKGLIFAPTDEPAPKPKARYSKNLGELSDRTPVTVKITGPFNAVMVSQCPKGVKNMRRCTQLGEVYGEVYGEEPVRYTEPTTSGVFKLDVEVRRALWHKNKQVDCAAVEGACQLVAWSYDYGVIGKRKALTFVEAGPLAAPAVDVKHRNLLHNELVTAKLTGMPDTNYLEVLYCVASKRSKCRSLAGVGSTGGDITVEFRIPQILYVFNDEVDCASAEGVCELRFQTSGPRFDVPVSFEPDQPAPGPPAIVVTPSTKLLDRQAVEVRVSESFGYFGVLQCPIEADASFGQCAYLSYAGWEMDNGTGDSVATVNVRRVIPTTDGSRVDCGEKLRRCKLAILDQGSNRVVGEKRIQFDTSVAPPPPPSVVVGQAEGLVDGQDIEVTVVADSPYLRLLQCAGEDIRYGERCREMASKLFDGGPETFTVGVSRMVAGLDCLKVACSVVVLSDMTGLAEASALITFDADAPLRGAPTLAVSPQTALADRQPVTVTFTGLVDWRSYAQCVVVDGKATNRCRYLQAAYDGINRAVSVQELAVRRMIGDFDCAEVAQSCAIVVSYSDPQNPYEGEGRKKKKLLTFDPDAQPFPGPSAAVTPSTGLADGDVVVVSGENFHNSFEVFVGICSAPVDAASIEEGFGQCAGEASASTMVDADGTFSLEFGVLSVLRSYIGGTFTCTDGCVVLITDGTEFVNVEISFDPDATPSGQKVTNAVVWPEFDETKNRLGTTSLSRPFSAEIQAG